MAVIVDLFNLIPEPAVAISPTSYGSAHTTGVATTTQVLNTLRRVRYDAESVKVMTADPLQAVPEAVPYPAGAGTLLADRPYQSTRRDVVMKVVAAGCAVPNHSVRDLNSGPKSVVKFVKSFLADAVRAELDRQLILGDVGGDPNEFDGFESGSTPKITGAANNDGAINQLATLDRLLLKIRRGAGAIGADVLYMNTDAMEKVIRCARVTQTPLSDRSIGGTSYTAIRTAAGMLPIVPADNIPTLGNLTSIYAACLYGPNGMHLATPTGTLDVTYNVVQDPGRQQQWVTAEMVAALIVQDDTKLGQFTDFDLDATDHPA